MIRTRYFLYRTSKSCLQAHSTLYRKSSGKAELPTHSWTSINLKCYSTTVAIDPSSQVKMNTFKLLDYDCIGFDLDNTLLRYNVSNMVHVIYEILANYLITERGYNSKYLLKPLQDADLDFLQKGLFLDFEKGNILRINGDGIIQRACHGSKLLSVEQIKEIYPEQQWEVTNSFCNDMLSTWNGPLSTKMRSLLDYFDISASLIFARLVDGFDEEQGSSMEIYNIWPDILDGIIEMFNKDHFKADKGYFFPSLKSNPEKYMYKCTTKTKNWLKEIKNHRITFLITGSYADFVDFTATYALGEDWKSLFDIVICYAKKPSFFTENRPFIQVVNLEDSGVVEGKDLKRGEIYSQGNWTELAKFLGHVSHKEQPRCLYVGDNLLQDIYAPSMYELCDTIAVIEEQMSEGMVHKALSHPDEKVLNSTFWGSYFCLKDSKTNMDSLWGSIIKRYSKLCIPEIDIIAQQPIDKSYLTFSKNGNKYDGYYPAVPLSISTF